MGKTTSVSSTNATACCNYVSSTTQSSGIPGVTCGWNGYPIEINWNSQGLKGQIPPEMGNLKPLRRLMLDWNQLNGSIPPEIGNLVNLNRLSIVGNFFTGLWGTFLQVKFLQRLEI